jgi:hypothetical protein
MNRRPAFVIHPRRLSIGELACLFGCELLVAVAAIVHHPI